MTSRTIPTALVLALLLFAPGFATAANYSRMLGSAEEATNYTLIGGLQQVNDDWRPVSRMMLLGADWDYTGRDWPMGLTAAAFFATGTDSSGYSSNKSVTNNIYQLQVGVRKLWSSQRQGRFTPYLGGGVAVARGSWALNGDRDEGMGFGGWIGGGCRVLLFGGFHLGLDVRYAGVPLRIAGQTLDGGGLMAGLTFGYVIHPDW